MLGNGVGCRLIQGVLLSDLLRVPVELLLEDCFMHLAVFQQLLPRLEVLLVFLRCWKNVQCKEIIK